MGKNEKNIEKVEQSVLEFLDKQTSGWSDDDLGEVFDLIKNSMMMRLEEME